MKSFSIVVNWTDFIEEKISYCNSIAYDTKLTIM